MALLTPELFASEQPSHLIIALGSPPSRPLELYSLSMPATGRMHRSFSHVKLQADDRALPYVLTCQRRCKACSEEQAVVGIEDIVRRTMRRLVMNTQDMPEGKASTGDDLNMRDA